MALQIGEMLLRAVAGGAGGIKPAAGKPGSSWAGQTPPPPPIGQRGGGTRRPLWPVILAIVGVLLIVAIAIVVVLVAGGGNGAGGDGDLPDLVVRGALIELESGGRCDYASTQLGVRVVVENAGAADAGPFDVEVNGVGQTVAGGLAAGESLSLWVAGYEPMGENEIIVDVLSNVKEGDEGNNTFIQRLPVPTLPPTCTPSS